METVRGRHTVRISGRHCLLNSFIPNIRHIHITSNTQRYIKAVTLYRIRVEDSQAAESLQRVGVRAGRRVCRSGNLSEFHTEFRSDWRADWVL